MLFNLPWRGYRPATRPMLHSNDIVITSLKGCSQRPRRKAGVHTLGGKWFRGFLRSHIGLLSNLVLLLFSLFCILSSLVGLTGGHLPWSPHQPSNQGIVRRGVSFTSSTLCQRKLRMFLLGGEVRRTQGVLWSLGPGRQECSLVRPSKSPTALPYPPLRELVKRGGGRAGPPLGRASPWLSCWSHPDLTWPHLFPGTWSHWNVVGTLTP